MSIVKNGDVNIVNIPSGLVPKGAYNGATDYNVGDSVDYLGSSYVMFNNAGPGTLPTNTTYWQVLANKGNAGSTGPAGPAGDATANSGTLIIGDGTDGSWRAIIVAGVLSIQKRESGIWNAKSNFQP